MVRNNETPRRETGDGNSHSVISKGIFQYHVARLLIDEWVEKHCPASEDLVYRSVTGARKREWLFPINSPAPALRIFLAPLPAENKPGYRGSRGFGGATLIFKMENGEEKHIKGPWWSNSEALYIDTSIDLRCAHVTMGAIGMSRTERDEPEGLKDLLYADTLPVVGTYDRIKKLGWNLLMRRDLHQQLFFKRIPWMLYSMVVSPGGMACGTVKPPIDKEYLSAERGIEQNEIT